MVTGKAVSACGRDFTYEDIETIRKEIQLANPPLRAEIARRVCRSLGWRDAQGNLKAMSCRVALLRFHRRGLISLPPPRNGNGNDKPLTKQRSELPPSEAVVCAVHELEGLELVRVQTKADSALYNGLIERYHYLGYQRLPGAQLRYLIRWREGVLGAMGWGAAAWKVRARDQWIGWAREVRERGLHQVLNNARFLILPWVRCQNLASKVLALSERCVPADFQACYGVRPVLFETFVEQGRFRATCYRAANWRYLGHTQGRGKCDRTHLGALPVKSVFVRPLIKNFRAQLGTGA